MLVAVQRPSWGISENVNPETHFKPHIHRAKSENIEAGLRPEKDGEETDAFASYRDALVYFLKTINVTKAEQFFPELHQSRLFDIGEGNESTL